MLVNKTSHKFIGKLGQKVDKTKCGHNYKIILPDNEIVVTKLENECNFISSIFVFKHCTG